MLEIISNKRCMTQFGLYWLALLLTILYFIKPDWFFYPAVITWLINFVVFWLNLLGAVVIYIRVSRMVRS